MSAMPVLGSTGVGTFCPTQDEYQSRQTQREVGPRQREDDGWEGGKDGGQGG